VLEAAWFMRRAGAGPRGTGARAGGGEDDLPAAVRREDEVVAAQGDRFLRAQLASRTMRLPLIRVGMMRIKASRLPPAQVQMMPFRRAASSAGSVV
jgi:hypothetical protein